MEKTVKISVERSGPYDEVRVLFNGVWADSDIIEMTGHGDVEFPYCRVDLGKYKITLERVTVESDNNEPQP